MAFKKYINTTEVVKLTGLSYGEVINLVKTGVLPSHRNRKGHYRLNVEAVEKYFNIVINKPAEESGSSSTEKPIKDSKQEKDGRYICGYTARRYLKCSKTTFASLVEQGIIQGHRDESKRWKVSKESLLNYAKRSLTSSETHLIINENHYEEVIQRICMAKTSIRIMTANFKRFNLKPTDKQGKEYKDGTPFVKYLMAKAVQGVSVQIICSKPSSYFTEEWKEYYRQMNPELFEYKFCERNHAKVIIVDDEFTYVGSANITPAGIGQGIFTPGNFEAGILTKNKEVISFVKDLFSKIWSDDYCTNCHRADKCQ